MKALNDEEGEHEIGLTPLIDVVFLLLVFFLVSTSFVRPEKTIDVKLPRASEGAEGAAKRGTLVVNVMETGMLRAGGRILQGTGELVEILRVAHKQNPELMVIIRGDRNARHMHVVKAMNAALQAGIGKMSIAVFQTPDE
jgi:biopolymer transport protein ExbD